MHNQRRGQNQRRFGLSSVRQVYFIHKPIYSHEMQTEYQMILPNALSSLLLEISINLLPNHTPIAPQFLPVQIMIYPPISDNLEWIEMQTGLPLSGLLTLYCQTSSLTQRLQT